jgi:hypothetical protein
VLARAAAQTSCNGRPMLKVRTCAEQARCSMYIRSKASLILAPTARVP